VQVESRVESAWWQRVRLNIDNPLSNFACKFNLRRYNEAGVFDYEQLLFRLAGG
jgi:hypothetical protein